MLTSYFLKILVSKPCPVFIHVISSPRLVLFPANYQYTRYQLFSQYEDWANGYFNNARYMQGG